MPGNDYHPKIPARDTHGNAHQRQMMEYTKHPDQALHDPIKMVSIRPDTENACFQTQSHHEQPPPGMQAYGHQAYTKAQGRENQGQMAPTLPQGPRHPPVARQDVLPPSPQQTVNFDPQRRVYAQKEDNALLNRLPTPAVSAPIDMPKIEKMDEELVTEHSTEGDPCGDNKEVRSAVSKMEPDPGISVVSDKRWTSCL